MKELLERELLFEIKNRFFDLLSADRQSFYYPELLAQMLLSLQSVLNAEEIDFYACEESKQGLIVEATTRKADTSKHKAAFSNCMLINNMAEEHVFIKSPDFIPGFEKYPLTLLLTKNGKFIGMLAFQMKIELHASDWLLDKISHECTTFIDKIRGLADTLAEEKRYKQLFRVTEKFHSTMDMDAVLGEIISTLQEVYPSFTYYLLLSHDHKGYSGLPVKDLEYDSDNLTAMQSYVSGQIQFEDSVLEKNSIMYAPLKGRQGVYGVLQIVAPDSLIFPQNEVEFIKVLANTAGSALENAKLYEQSRKLIADLQLINETSHQLNSSMRLTDSINFICGQIVKSFKAEEVGFIMLDAENGAYTVLQGSTNFFFCNEASQYVMELGVRIQKEMEPLFLGDLDYLKQPNQVFYRSVMAVPMVQSGSLKGFALVLHKNPYHFAFETFKLLQSLIHHSTLAFTNSILREELEKMVVTDHLTRLYSRGYLDEKMNQSMLEDAQGTFILIDIDNFKSVNDTYGHQVGDEVLVQLARQIAKNIRATDIGSRWGGEELAIYLPGAPLEIGVLIANRLVERVEQQTKPSVTISCGVSAWIKGQGDSVKSLFKRADQALYLAKSSGKNKVIIQKDNQYEFCSTQD